MRPEHACSICRPAGVTEPPAGLDRGRLLFARFLFVHRYITDWPG